MYDEQTDSVLSDGAADTTPVDRDGVEDFELSHGRRLVLLWSVLLVAACGLAYEIIAGAVSTYLLGDGVLQFSLTIGIFLSAMGLGSFISRFVRTRLLRTFFVMEILIGVIGGSIPAVLLWVYASGGPYLPVLILMLGAVGILAGMEIPILLRTLRHFESLRMNASSVLGLDYAGALIGSLAVPILLIPVLGTIGSGCLFGLLNLVVALVGVWVFPEAFRGSRRVAIAIILLLMIPMAGGVVFSGAIAKSIESGLYQDPVVYAKNTPFQRIVVTRWRGDMRLFLNGSLQFASRDEYRYHEGLVHPAMAVTPRRTRVLMLGGGDGMGLREVLKYDDVESVTLVDLDPGVTSMAASHPDFVRINKNALNDPRATVINTDALEYLKQRHSPWDVIIMDLPDPSNSTLSRLYAQSSFRLVTRHLAADGVLVTQGTSPFFARDAFWCIADTVGSVHAGGQGGPRLKVRPYRVVVPSFGVWGFTMATGRDIDVTELNVTVPTRHVTTELLPSLFAWPADEGRPEGPACINRLNDAVLARVYRRGWSRYGE